MFEKLRNILERRKLTREYVNTTLPKTREKDISIEELYSYYKTAVEHLKQTWLYPVFILAAYGIKYRPSCVHRSNLRDSSFPLYDPKYHVPERYRIKNPADKTRSYVDMSIFDVPDDYVVGLSAGPCPTADNPQVVPLDLPFKLNLDPYYSTLEPIDNEVAYLVYRKLCHGFKKQAEYYGSCMTPNVLITYEQVKERLKRENII